MDHYDERKKNYFFWLTNLKIFNFSIFLQQITVISAAKFPFLAMINFSQKKLFRYFSSLYNVLSCNILNFMIWSRSLWDILDLLTFEKNWWNLSDFLKKFSILHWINSIYLFQFFSKLQNSKYYMQLHHFKYNNYIKINFKTKNFISKNSNKSFFRLKFLHWFSQNLLHTKFQIFNKN
jgi:hypothetical protein